MAYHNKQHFRITNKLTGETMEFTYTSMQEAEAVYIEIKSMLDIFTRAEKRIKEYIGKQVDDSYDFGDGFVGRWINPMKKRYLPEVVRKYLDEDQMSEVMDINPVKLKAMFKQLVEDSKGTPGAWTDIEQSAEVTPGKSYFVIRKN